MKHIILFHLIFLSAFAKCQVLDWGKSFGGHADDRALSIASDEENAIVVAGVFTDTIKFDLQSAHDRYSLGHFDVFIIKYDSLGQLLWTSSVGSKYYDYVYDLKIDNGNNIFLTGFFTSGASPDTIQFSNFDTTISFVNTGGNPDGYIMKLDSLGNLIFINIISGVNAGQEINLDAFNNIYLAGWFGGNVDFDPGLSQYSPETYGSADAFIACYDSIGNFKWVKSMGSSNDDDMFSSIQINKSGNIYASGSFSKYADLDPDSANSMSPCNYGGVSFAKYNNVGSLLWAKHLCGVNFSGTSMMIDSTSTIHLIGRIEVPVDFDPSVGTFHLYPINPYDWFIAKYDSSGSFISANLLSGDGSDLYNNLYVEESGSFILTGLASQTDIDLSSDSIILSSTLGSKNFFISEYDLNNNLIGWIEAGFAGNIKPTCITKDKSGSYCVAGYYTNNICLTPGCANIEFLSNGVLDCFVAKYNSLPFMSGIYENRTNIFSIYPNPSHGKFIIKGNLINEDYLFQVIDIYGRFVFSQQFAGTEEYVVNTNLSSGIYHVEIRGKNVRFASKVVVY